MSINGISNTDKNFTVENAKDLSREKNLPASSALNTLTQVTDKSSLSALTPRLQPLLKAIDHPEDNVLQTMSNNISNLQDAFVEAVYDTLTAENIDLSEKVTLRLGAEQLVVSGEHPDKELIETSLAKVPALSEAFKEIASQSELLRDVSNIGKVIGARTGVESYRNSYNQVQNSTYQISMKGDMSHFYFTKS